MPTNTQVSNGASLVWFEKEVLEEYQGGFIKALNQYGAEWEGHAKHGVSLGAGVYTGTFKRSLHYASPSYNFAADDVVPSFGSPERAGTGGGAAVQADGRVGWAAGSGLSYAIYVEQMFGAIMNAYRIMNAKLMEIVKAHAPR